MAISLTYTFSAGTRILSSQVNANFSTLATRALDKTGDTMTGDLVMDTGTGITLAGTELTTWTGVGGFPCDGRLTLTSGTAITTADVTGAGTIYFTPYQGNRIALYDGSAWSITTFSERSLALSVSSGTNYDVFLYNNSGTLTLELTAWTNDTTRATALTTQDGVLVKTGATTRRYLGTIRGSGANTTEDSFAKRFVWNYYNRVLRPMRVLEATNNWSYTTATWRQANGSTANQLDFVLGAADVMLDAWASGSSRSDAASNERSTGIGLDSTSSPAASCLIGSADSTDAADTAQTVAALRAFPGVGRHTAVWLEISQASGTTTWLGDAGTGTPVQTGIHGTIEG